MLEETRVDSALRVLKYRAFIRTPLQRTPRGFVRQCYGSPTRSAAGNAVNGRRRSNLVDSALRRAKNLQADAFRA